jgi:hypothetical protein
MALADMPLACPKFAADLDTPHARVACFVGKCSGAQFVRRKVQQGVAMRSQKSAKTGSQRIPLTITLNPENYAFIESCVSLKEFDSVDKFFDAALAFYGRHLSALHAYAEQQSHKGYTRSEILESIECETVVTRTVAPRQQRRR